MKSSKLGKLKAIVSGDVPVALSEELPQSVDEVTHFFRVPLIQDNAADELLRSIQTKISNEIIDLKTEQCFNVGLETDLSSEKLLAVRWLLGET